MSAMHIMICNLLRLDVFVQFFLPILQAHCDIRGPFRPPKKIKIIAQSLALIESRHSAK